MWVVLLRNMSLPARGTSIRECLSISARNLVAFSHPAERKRKEEGERERERDEKSGRDKEKATCGRCGFVAFTECHLV